MIEQFLSKPVEVRHIRNRGSLAGPAIGGQMKRRYLLKGLAAVPLLIAPVWRGWAAIPARGPVNIEALQKNWKEFLA